MLLRNLSLQVEVKEGSALTKALILLYDRARSVCEPPHCPTKPICWPKATIRYFCMQCSKERGWGKTKKRFSLLQLVDCIRRKGDGGPPWVIFCNFRIPPCPSHIDSIPATSRTILADFLRQIVVVVHCAFLSADVVQYFLLFLYGNEHGFQRQYASLMVKNDLHLFHILFIGNDRPLRPPGPVRVIAPG